MEKNWGDTPSATLMGLIEFLTLTYIGLNDIELFHLCCLIPLPHRL